MDQTISAAEANRRFSKILREVKEGTSYVVTSHGTPVAKIVPASATALDRTAAKEAWLARLRAQPFQVLNERWTRDELYDP